MQFTTLISFLLGLLTYVQALPQPSVEISAVVEDSTGNLDDAIDVSTLRKRAQNFVWCCSDMPDAHGWWPTANDNAGLNIAQLIGQQRAWYFEARTCTIVTCIGQASITLCNDNFSVVEVSAYTIGGYAGAIQDVCGWRGKGHCGQTFDTTNFNVVLHAENCTPGISLI